MATCGWSLTTLICGANSGAIVKPTSGKNIVHPFIILFVTRIISNPLNTGYEKVNPSNSQNVWDIERFSTSGVKHFDLSDQWSCDKNDEELSENIISRF